jgi:hypothetical protein
MATATAALGEATPHLPQQQSPWPVLARNHSTLLSPPDLNKGRKEKRQQGAACLLVLQSNQSKGWDMSVRRQPRIDTFRNGACHRAENRLTRVADTQAINRNNPMQSFPCLSLATVSPFLTSFLPPLLSSSFSAAKPFCT